MKSVLWILFFILSFVMGGAVTQAQGSQPLYQGVRGLGMGGVSIPTVNDETALLINPAGLSRLRDYIITYFDPEVSFGQESLRMVMSDSAAMYNLDELFPYLQDRPSVSYHGKFQMFPSFVLPNFGVGLLLKRELSARSSADGSTVDLSYLEDWAATMGYSLDFWGGILRLGFSGRYHSRKFVDQELDGTEPELTIEALGGAGTGVGWDVGLLATAPIAYLPTLAFVMRDVGTTTYSLGGGFFGAMDGGTPDPSLESWDVGLSLSPIHGNQVRSTWGVEYRGINRALLEGESFQRRFHAGWELNIYDQIFLRAGMNQKYWTAGFEIATSWYQFQVASYGEEVALLPHSKEDRRYVTKFSLRF